MYSYIKTINDIKNCFENNTICKRDDNGNTLYLYCCKMGYLKCIEYIDARIQVRNDINQTIHKTINTGKPRIQSENLKCYYMYKNKSEENNYLLAARYGHLEILKYLDESPGLTNRYAVNKSGMDAYLLAASEGHVEIMKYFEQTNVKSMYWSVNITNICDEGTYLVATTYGHVNVMKYLENKKCDIYIKNRDGNNAFHLAVLNSKYDVLKHLTDTFNYNINVLNKLHQNPYILAVIDDNTDMVKYLETEFHCFFNYLDESVKKATKSQIMLPVQKCYCGMCPKPCIEYDSVYSHLKQKKNILIKYWKKKNIV